MAIEDFTTYTEEDPNSRITRTTRRVTWTAITRAEDAYVWKDKGANFFGGDFVHYLTIRSISTTGPEGTAANIDSFWALANLIEDYVGISDASGDGFFLFFRAYTIDVAHKIFLVELDGGQTYFSSEYEITADTNYYLKIVRDESAGTYGTLYCYVYSDSQRTTLVATLSRTLHSSKKDFRHIYALQTINTGDSTRSHTGYTEDLELFGASDPSVVPTVTTQPVTSITATTATGNGIIVDLGLSAVSQHGHCWDSTIDPTTTDSSSGFWGKTSEGAGSVGAFTSSMGSLLAGQQYYVRTYATNTQGTAYGANVVFIATSETTSTQLIQGNLAIVQGHLQYIDASGIEKYIPGIPA